MEDRGTENRPKIKHQMTQNRFSLEVMSVRPFCSTNFQRRMNSTVWRIIIFQTCSLIETDILYFINHKFSTPPHLVSEVDEQGAPIAILQFQRTPATIVASNII